MEPKIIYAVDKGIQSFLQSKDCSSNLREKIELETKDCLDAGMHFHDLTAREILVTSLAAFLTSVAANISTRYFENKISSIDDAKEVALTVMEVRRNEIRLKLGPKGIEEIIVSIEEIEALSKHVYEACKEIKE